MEFTWSHIYYCHYILIRRVSTFKGKGTCLSCVSLSSERWRFLKAEQMETENPTSFKSENVCHKNMCRSFKSRFLMATGCTVGLARLSINSLKSWGPYLYSLSGFLSVYLSALSVSVSLFILYIYRIPFQNEFTFPPHELIPHWIYATYVYFQRRVALQRGEKANLVEGSMFILLPPPSCLCVNCIFVLAQGIKVLATLFWTYEGNSLNVWTLWVNTLL